MVVFISAVLEIVSIAWIIFLNAIVIKYFL